MAQLVNFFIIGVQKGGTTSLDARLRAHPSLQMARVKEVHYFDNESIDWLNPSPEQLHKQFDWTATDVLRGEITPIYIYWPQSLARLRRYNPAARLIVSLRHPTFRAFSQWRMDRSRGYEHMPFDQAISSAGRARVTAAPGKVHRTFSYVERSLYAPQIATLLSLFPREQVHFLRTDHLWLDPENILTSIERFLNVQSLLGSIPDRTYVTPVPSNGRETLPPSTRVTLDKLFQEDIELTARLTGLDLADWLGSHYEEPMRQDPQGGAKARA